jgi:uncharacterized protein YdaU (DUF1376 family)
MAGEVALFMPWYPRDYRADTTDLTLEEHGAYRLLLDDLWVAGGAIPFDAARLARRIGVGRADWDRLWKTLARFFQVVDGELRQKRVGLEISKAVERRERERARTAAATEARNNQRNGGRNEKRNGGRYEERNDAEPSDATADVTSTTAPAPAPTTTTPATAPPHAHTTARARARDEDQVQGLDAKAVETRKAALAIADDWRPLRRKVDPADPITADDDAWSLAREEQAGHVVRLLQAGHTADLIRQTLTWAMHDGGDGGRWKGWRYQIATLADLGLHFAKIRKAIVAAQASAESAGPNGRKVRLYDPSKGSWEVPPAEANRLEREREQAARDRAAGDLLEGRAAHALHVGGGRGQVRHGQVSYAARFARVFQKRVRRAKGSSLTMVPVTTGPRAGSYQCATSSRSSCWIFCGTSSGPAP